MRRKCRKPDEAQAVASVVGSHFSELWRPTAPRVHVALQRMISADMLQLMIDTHTSTNSPLMLLTRAERLGG